MNVFRWIFVFLFASVVGLTIAACNGDDAGDAAGAAEPTTEVAAEEPSATPEPEPTPTPVPTPEPTPAPEPTPTPASEPAMTDEEIRAYLLTIDDLPEGWTQMIDEDEPDPDLEEGPAGFCDAPPLDEQLEAVASAEAEFTGSDFGPFVFQTLALTQGEADAQFALEWLHVAVDCEEWVDDESGFVWRSIPSSFPDIGDESFATRVTTEFEGLTMEMDLILVQKGAFVTMILHMNLGSVDPALSEELVSVAIEKLPE